MTYLRNPPSPKYVILGTKTDKGGAFMGTISVCSDGVVAQV